MTIRTKQFKILLPIIVGISIFVFYLQSTFFGVWIDFSPTTLAALVFIFGENIFSDIVRNFSSGLLGPCF